MYIYKCIYIYINDLPISGLVKCMRGGGRLGTFHDINKSVARYSPGEHFLLSARFYFIKYQCFGEDFVLPLMFYFRVKVLFNR